MIWRIIAVASLILAVAIAAYVTGCSPANTAKDAFRVQLDNCEIQAATRAEAVLCRNQVEAKWAIADAGVDVKDLSVTITITSVDAGAE